jgi:DNA-binding protein YbaB
MTAETQPPMSKAMAGAHPQVAGALEQLQRMQSVLEGVADQTANEIFTGTDEDKTVSATITGLHVLTNLYIEDGLLRLGAETVEHRVNEALRNATIAATTAVAAQHEELFATLTEATNELKTGLGLE